MLAEGLNPLAGSVQGLLGFVGGSFLGAPGAHIFLLGVEFFQAVTGGLECAGRFGAAPGDSLQRAGGFVDGVEQHPQF
ncbi:hypothetical protein KFF47_26020 [Pseudomonas fluorescens]|nr:hypothetical protein [Pseudomonas fluorescens]